MDKHNLRSIANKLELARGPDRLLCAEILVAMCDFEEWLALDQFGTNYDPTYTIDAALDLVKQKLPGSDWGRDKNGSIFLYQVDGPFGEPFFETVYRNGPTVPLAILRALLAVLINQDQ